MKLNSYIIVERAVIEGVAAGFQRASNIKDETDPNKIIDLIAGSVMNEITTVIDFSEDVPASVLIAMAQQEAKEEVETKEVK